MDTAPASGVLIIRLKLRFNLNIVICITTPHVRVFRGVFFAFGLKP